jgi:hypothetical protein
VRMSGYHDLMALQQRSSMTAPDMGTDIAPHVDLPSAPLVEVAVRLGTETGVGIEHGGRDRVGEGSGGVAGSGEGYPAHRAQSQHPSPCPAVPPPPRVGSGISSPSTRLASIQDVRERGLLVRMLMMR